jgi:L-aminopeptidase/D-esterase-like protein
VTRRRFLPRALCGAGAALLVVSLASPGSAVAPAPIVPSDAACQSDAACLAVFDRVGEAAKRAMGRAIVHAVVSAKTVGGVLSYCDQFAGACATSGPAGYPNGTGKTGRYNNITDVPGIKVGSHTEPTNIGTTVVLTPAGTTAGVEVRGSAPGGRGTDANRSDQAVQKIDAVVLTGGSAFGLAAGDGVARYLEEHGRGAKLDASGAVMPVVPTSVIFDLGRFGRPWAVHATPDFGFKAATSAKAGPHPQGSVGGGAGAEAGGVKGGLGFASEDLGGGVMVGAVVDINAAGAPMDTGTGCAFHSARYQIGREFGSLRPPPAGCDGFTSIFQSSAGKNTTIGIVATNIALSRPLLSKLAQYGQDGLALAIRPSHAYFDGDTVWSLSTNSVGGATAVAAPSATKPTGGVARGNRPAGAVGGTLPATGSSAALGALGALVLAAGLLLGWRTRGRRVP